MLPLTVDLVEFLASLAGQQAITSLTDADLESRAELATLARLRKTFPREQAAALLDQARLRRRAADKFPHPERLLFTDDALQ
ncbi:MAG: SAM-dependent methyltransferase, partial [Anaerolineae bacterium]|nr:SAM-dependent methyltransferase [Anaerolineae bacterium]